MTIQERPEAAQFHADARRDVFPPKADLHLCTISDRLDDVCPISNAQHNVRSAWSEVIDGAVTKTQRDQFAKNALKLVTAARNGTDPGPVKLGRINYRLAKSTDE